MNIAIDDVSSYVVSESGAFPSVNELDNLAEANRLAIRQEMERSKQEVRLVIRKMLEGSIGKMEALRDIRNILHEGIELPDLRNVLNDALSEHPELMVGGKRKTRRGKRRGSKRSTKRVSNKSKRGQSRTKRLRSKKSHRARRSHRGGKI